MNYSDKLELNKMLAYLNKLEDQLLSAMHCATDDEFRRISKEIRRVQIRIYDLENERASK
jgi:metal-dependent hydrolase (beta-lactamase superfamily II)